MRWELGCVDPLGDGRTLCGYCSFFLLCLASVAAPPP